MTLKLKRARMTTASSRRVALATLLFGAALAACAVEPVPFDTALREAVTRVPVAVQDLYGRRIAGELVVTTYRPAGPGPFPLAVISHGRPASLEALAEMPRQRFVSAARYFVRKGFAVAVPLRLGAGELQALGDPEAYGSCSRPNYLPGLQAAAQQIAAVAAQMQREPDIDASRLLLVGVSAGGIASVAAVAQGMPGLVAGINFAGGRGGDPVRRPGEPCGPAQLTQAMQGFGAQAKAPMLWIYAENDQFFSPAHSRAWADAYARGGAPLDYVLEGPHGKDGHRLFGTGNAVWQPHVDRFLAGLGQDVPAGTARALAR